MTNQPLRILFMGTPDFAAASLRRLHEQRNAHGWQVIAVFTQPDRPAGRGNKLAPSPVKQYALAHQLPVFQPQRLRKAPDAVAEIQALAPDLIVVAAYGLILPPPVLAIPRYGCLNVHASLLPAYRGASPITAAILDGRPETGVSIMQMDEGMDTGPVLTQARTAIQAQDTTASLGARLAGLGAELLVNTIPAWIDGNLRAIPQHELPGQVSICRLIRKEDGRIDWRRPAIEIERMTRAYTPWPSAYTTWRGELLKIWQGAAIDGQAEPGLVVSTPHGGAVGAGNGLVLLHTVQPAGKRTLDIRSFLNGAADFIGSRLGDA
ncbi:MAG: methionyl-tRNA formyltransferase [Caldilineaceae bacterium]|nr:methionyl-tRNA formyltransferase [Caldilineaceae bacterium]